MSPTAALLAAELVEARRAVTPIDASDDQWADLDIATAGAVSQEMLAIIGAVDSPYWKLGAVDEPTQERLGLSAPITAPLAPTNVGCDVEHATIDRATLVMPKFEPEIGVLVREGRLLAMPCVEVADSRFAGWRLPPYGVIADAALQGQMLFGIPVAPQDVIDVTVSLDGVVLATGSGNWADAVERLDLIDDRAGPTHVATGSLTALFDCAPGLWTFDFGPIGRIDVTVV